MTYSQQCVYFGLEKHNSNARHACAQWELSGWCTNAFCLLPFKTLGTIRVIIECRENIVWLCVCDGSHKNIWTWKLNTAMHPSSDGPSVVSMTPDISCVSSLSHFSLCVFGHGLVLVHWRWAVSCLQVSTHMVWITHLLLVTSLDHFIKKQQAVSLCCMKTVKLSASVCCVWHFWGKMSPLWDVPAKIPVAYPRHIFWTTSMISTHAACSFWALKAKRKKKERELQNINCWRLGEWKRNAKWIMGSPPAARLLSVIEWESPQFAFQVKGHPAFYLKNDTDG